MRQGKEYCDARQIKSELLDQKVISIFNQIATDPEIIDEYLRTNHKSVDIKSEKAKLEKQKSSANEKITNLTATLEDNQDTSDIKYIIQRIENLDKEIKLIDRKIAELQAEERSSKESEEDAEEKQSKISKFMEDFERFTADERNAIARDFIKECTWDGKTLFLKL